MTDTIQTAKDTRAGIAWAFASALGGSGMAIAIRGANDELASAVTAGYRAVFMMLVLMLVLLLVPSIRASVRFSQPIRHLIRGVCFGISVLLGFYALAVIPLTTATVLFFLAPIFASLFGFFFMGQHLGPRRIAATVMGFIGALIVLRPGYLPLNLGMLSAVGSSVLFAVGLVMTRNLAKIDGPFSTLLSSTFITLLIAVPISLPDFVVPTQPATWGWVILLVAVSFLRQVSDIQAYKLAEATVIAPMTYLRLVFTGIAAYLVFAEIPDWPTVIGAAVIISAALYIAHRERQVQRTP